MAILSLLIISCAKKKDEVAQLEQDMMEQETPVVDTDVDAGAVPPESVAVVDIYEGESASLEGSVAPMPKAPGGEGYAVQIAACESPDYAQYLVEKYVDRGYEPYVTTVNIDGQTYYRVRLGKYDTREEANNLKDKLNDMYSIEAWIDWETY